MKLADLTGKNVCILGFGREGKVSLQMLELFAPQARITIADQNHVKAGDYPVISGADYLTKLSEFDVIIKTPGIAWEPPAELYHKITNATQIFLDSLPRAVQVIGVTGTKGKSSTATLIHHLLKESGRSTFLAGNIGEPMLSLLPEVKDGDIVVLELSSYQLSDITTSPEIAVITSFFPDHTDYHGSVAAYFDAKSNIARYQTARDTIFFNADFSECRQLAELSPGLKVSFSGNDLSADLKNIAAPGAVPSNMAAAVLVSRHLGLSEAEIVKGVLSAPKLAHRQQLIGEYAGVNWVEDSAATTPQSTQEALWALGDTVDTLIVGGLNRDYDFTTLGQQIATSKITNVVLFPDTGRMIRKQIEAASANKPKYYFETSSIDEAVAWAAKHTAAGKTCLLSSGAPSYNLFQNFGERGDAFQKAVVALDSAN